MNDIAFDSISSTQKISKENKDSTTQSWKYLRRLIFITKQFKSVVSSKFALFSTENPNNDNLPDNKTITEEKYIPNVVAKKATAHTTTSYQRNFGDVLSIKSR